MRTALSLLVGLSSLVAVGDGARAAPPPRLDVLVVAGQSNALGYESYVVDPRTHLDVFTDASRSPADNQVLLTWDETGVTAPASAVVALDTPQVRKGAPSPIFGPELGLARALYAAGHHHLLIVKVAVDGSSLAVNWRPGGNDYQALIQKVDATLSWARARGWSPDVAGIYWFQGETDAMNASWASSYGANLTTLLLGLRLDLSRSPGVPVTIAQTDLADYVRFEMAEGLCPTPGCAGEWRWNAEVMAAQSAAAGASTVVTSTVTLTRVDNFLHLSNTAELKLGKTFASLTAPLLP